MEIIFFGQLADMAGAAACRIEGVQDTTMLTAKLESMFPGLENVKYMLAVNRKMVQENVPLTGNETIALMPPFSGG
jgi:molybdopterin synthase sulfur carrier subunit